MRSCPQWEEARLLDTMEQQVENEIGARARAAAPVIFQQRVEQGPVIIGWEVVSRVRTKFVIFPREVRLKFGQIWGWWGRCQIQKFGQCGLLWEKSDRIRTKLRSH
jgi:hypothetical protein